MGRKKKEVESEPVEDDQVDIHPDLIITGSTRDGERYAVWGFVAEKSCVGQWTHKRTLETENLAEAKKECTRIFTEEKRPAHVSDRLEHQIVFREGEERPDVGTSNYRSPKIVDVLEPESGDPDDIDLGSYVPPTRTKLKKTAKKVTRKQN